MATIVDVLQDMQYECATPDGLTAAYMILVNVDGASRRFCIADPYQVGVCLITWLLDKGFSLDEACLLSGWAKNAKVGDTVTFPRGCVTASAR